MRGKRTAAISSIVGVIVLCGLWLLLNPIAPIIRLRQSGFALRDIAIGNNISVFTYIAYKSAPKEIVYLPSADAGAQRDVTRELAVAITQIPAIAKVNFRFLTYTPDAFAGVSFPKSLENVRLQDMRLTAVFAKSFASCSNINTINFTRVDFSPGAMEELSQFPNLAQLAMVNCAVPKGDIRKFRGFQKLKKLVIHGVNDVTDDDIVAFEGLSKLRVIVLEDIGISNKTLHWLARSSPLLESINVSGTRCTSDGISSLADLKNLYEIVFWRNHVRVSDLKAIAIGGGFPNLRRFAVTTSDADESRQITMMRNGRSVEFD